MLIEDIVREQETIDISTSTFNNDATIETNNVMQLQENTVDVSELHC